MIIIYNTNNSTKGFKIEATESEASSLIKQAKEWSTVCFVQEIYECYIDSAEDIEVTNFLPFGSLLLTDDNGNKLYKKPSRKIKQLIMTDMILLQGFYTFGYIVADGRKLGEWFAYHDAPTERNMNELKQHFGANMVVSTASPTIAPEIKHPLIKIYY